MTKRGGFPRANLSGDDTNGAQVEGVEESVYEGLETRQGVEVLDLDILWKGFSLKAEEVLIASHHRASFQKVFPPDRI